MLVTMGRIEEMDGWMDGWMDGSISAPYDIYLPPISRGLTAAKRACRKCVNGIQSSSDFYHRRLWNRLIKFLHFYS